MILQILLFSLIACSLGLNACADPLVTFSKPGEHTLTPAMYMHSKELLIQIEDGDAVIRFTIESFDLSYTIIIGKHIVIKADDAIHYQKVSGSRVTVSICAVNDSVVDTSLYPQIVALSLSAALLFKAAHSDILGVLCLIASGVYISINWGYLWVLNSVVIWLMAFEFIRMLNDTPYQSLLQRLRV